MASPRYASPSIPLGDGYSIEFTLDGGSLECAWTPAVPHARIGRKLLPAYRVARDGFLANVATAMGTRIMVVDL